MHAGTWAQTLFPDTQAGDGGEAHMLFFVDGSGLVRRRDGRISLFQGAAVRYGGPGVPSGHGVHV